MVSAVHRANSVVALFSKMFGLAIAWEWRSDNPARGIERNPESKRSSSVNAALIEDLARKAIRDIGYEQEGFHWQNVAIECLLHEQSADIAQGVDRRDNKDEGAGDQGIMFDRISADSRVSS